MTKTIKTLALLITVIMMSSFANKNNDQFFGTYGVSANNPSQIKLTIISDHTFYYQDFSASDNKIITTGSWTLIGSKVVLKENISKKKFHNVWTFDKNGQVARSQKGLLFYRLYKIEE